MCGSKWKLDKKCHLEIVKNLIFFLHQSCWWVMKRSVWESLISGIFKTDLSRLIIDHGFDIKKALFFSKKWHNEGGGSRKRKKSFFPLPLRNQQKKKLGLEKQFFFFHESVLEMFLKGKKQFRMKLLTLIVPLFKVSCSGSISLRFIEGRLKINN